MSRLAVKKKARGMFSTLAAMFGKAGGADQATTGYAQQRAASNAAYGNSIIPYQDHDPAGHKGNPADARLNESISNFNQTGTQSTSGGNKQIANFTGTLNAVGSTFTRIDEDGVASVFHFDAVSNAYVYHCDDGTVQNLVANHQGEWVWSGARNDARRAYEIYNPITVHGRKGDNVAQAQCAEHPKHEGPCRLAAVIAANGEATNYHYSPSGKLAGVVTVSGHQGHLGF